MMDLKESCGSQGSQESSSLRPTSWQAFAHSSTLHGLRFVFPYGQPSARRLLWAAALLTCLGLLALESAERFAYFLSYPHVTSVDAVVSSSLVFPAVTICNLNAYRFSRLTRNDLYHAGELLALLDVHLTIPQPHLAEPDVLAFLQEKANFTAYRPKAFSMKEFIERVGHDLKEMMLYCRYQGQDCSHNDFKPREGDWQAGRLEGRNGGGELSLDVNVKASCEEAADTRSGAVSRLADCMMRPE
ncbi:acid-sensing ion channel 2-like [Stegastes partitus]|uniref:Acid-sensing ion channel 2-like n=1 Tax=Stegastes partitus TaxID=144197 RepID=A0A9Y4K3L8_9TELE|nr:PREDICTED: acid-sensing ion channel 2-like [Stegastes partitus]